MYQHVTIVPPDSMIVVDGEALKFDFAAPVNLHAIQWHTGAGHMEFTDATNRAIEGPGDYDNHIAPYAALWEQEKARMKQERERPPSTEERIDIFTAAVQKYLDDFARTRNYDGITAAATYATSTIPKFKTEGQYAVEARDLTWTKVYAILDRVLSGAVPMPTIEEVIAELPPLEWPEVVS